MSAFLLKVMRISLPLDKPLIYCGTRSILSGVTLADKRYLTNRIERYYCTKKQNDSSLSTSARSEGEVSMSVKEAVKETTKTVSYLGVIILGVGVTAIMFAAIFSELFSSKSPNSVYAMSADKCCNDNRVKDALGEPLKAFGEETRRGRRRHTTHIVYVKDGVQHIRMVFYLQGSRNKGVVQLEMKEGSSGKYEYRYLFVQVDDYTRRVIVLEDNRNLESGSTRTPLDELDLSKPLSFS